VKSIRDLDGGVFEGERLHEEMQSLPVKLPILCKIPGQGRTGNHAVLNLDRDLFSKHLCFIGGIGSGKTNAIFHVVKQLRQSLAKDDVMVLFDTKGDFHQKFYGTGDVVISNTDELPGSDDYWNIFAEIDHSSEGRLKESVIEIAETLFYEKIHSSGEPFFANAAKDLFTAILLHFCRSENLEKNNAALKAFLDGSPMDIIREILGKYDDLRAMETYIVGGGAQAVGVFFGVATTFAQNISEQFC
jgi:type IV secretory pathway TraG/TraD family ATPase VirD4